MRLDIQVAAIAMALAPSPVLAEECHYSPMQLVEAFLRMMHDDKQPRAAFEKFVSKGYIEHNPWLDGDLESIIASHELQASANPDDETRIKRLIRDEDHIVVHRQSGIRPTAEGSIAVMEIFAQRTE